MNTGPITGCLTKLRGGDPAALDELFPLIYDELKIVARSQLAREATGHTLGPTALVHEAYVRLADREKLVPEDRRHFFAIAAQTMRRILIDHARSRKRAKRGSGQVAVPLEEIESLMTENAADELLALDDALDRLAAVNSRAAQVVERRFFAGLSLEETGDSLGVSLKTVQRDWLLARAWLRKEIDSSLPDQLSITRS
ncbi:MAG: sigma-70 family RNA polymerase sigma factor [Gemmatimonadetes bacterium]|nr:sigma-70 family RNA polymerase sigma factor [Gemmatimonadota bacterium]